MTGELTVGVLLRDKPALGVADDDKDNPWNCKAQKGDIIQEIPEKDRIRNPKHPSHNYRLYKEPNITLHTIPTEVGLLQKDEADYLLAVHPPSARVREYLNTQQLKEKMELKKGDVVFFKLKLSESALLSVRGKVQYIGPVHESEGIYFGIEILDDKYRGKGTTNGRPYFSCGANNGVFVSIDNISKKFIKNDQPPPQESAANTRNHKGRNTSPAVHHQPMSNKPQGRIDDGLPAANTRSSHKEASNPSVFQKAKEKVADFATNIFGNDPPLTKGESLPNVQYQYKPGDRVVLHSIHNVPIYGTVRWTGHVRVDGYSVSTVGVETDNKIDVNESLDVHYNVAGHGRELFKVSSGHSRVFVPEQLVICEYEYLEQKKKYDEIQNEQKVAKLKSLGISVEEYQAQKGLLDQANKERDDKLDQKANQQPFIPPLEEEGTACTWHEGIEDSVAIVTSGQPVNDERTEEERKALERFNSQVDDQPPHPVYHEYEKIPGLIQQRVIEGTGYVDIQYYTDQFKGSAGSDKSAGSSYGNSVIPVDEIRAIKHGRSPNMSNRENYSSSLPSILNERQPSVPVSSSPLNKEDEFAIGSMVMIPTQGGIDPLKGVVKWIGNLPEIQGLIAGVELDTEYPNCTDGTWKGRRFFKCPNGRGYFCPLRSLQQDEMIPIIENLVTEAEQPLVAFKSFKTLLTQQETETSKILQQVQQQVQQLLNNYQLMSAVEAENETIRRKYEEQVNGLTREKEGVWREKENLIKEKKKLETKVSIKEREIEALQSERKMAITGLTREFENEKKILKEEKATLEKKNATLEREKRELEQEKKTLKNDRETLKAEKATMEKEQVAVLDSLTEVQKKKQQLDDENKQLKDEQQVLQEKILANEQSWKINHKDVKMTRQELGRGGWGVIWVGEFRGQKVAVKQMHKSIVSEYYLELLHREINTMSQLRHPNLVQFIGAVLDDPSGQPLIITEIMDMSLRDAYEKKQLTPAPVNIPLAVMRDVAVGLNYLHCLPDPIIHRDVSSANVLLESKGHGRWKTKISDFGSAKFARAAITKAAGAAAYCAPEAFQSASILDRDDDQLLTPKMDVFSYGVLLCEVLTCQFPDQHEVFKAMLSLVRSQHHPYLHDLIQSCIKRNPQDRPNMDQVIQQLDSPHT